MQLFLVPTPSGSWHVNRFMIVWYQAVTNSRLQPFHLLTFGFLYTVYNKVCFIYLERPQYLINLRNLVFSLIKHEKLTTLEQTYQGSPLCWCSGR